jgi:hypothetical protein
MVGEMGFVGEFIVNVAVGVVMMVVVMGVKVGMLATLRVVATRLSEVVFAMLMYVSWRIIK